MIITCEECHARYLLASLLLGAKGRKVRCGVCGHTWYQEQEDEIYDRPDDAEEDTGGSEGDDGSISFREQLDHEMGEPIPEGVRPVPEGSAIPALHTKGSRSFPSADLSGLAMAALLFGLIAGILVGLRGPVVNAWVPAAKLYDMIGMPVPVEGEGLIFDQVKAVAKEDEDGTKTLYLNGNIMNVRGQVTTVPNIQATLRKSETETGPGWTIQSDGRKLDPEESMPFSAFYKDLPRDMTEVNIRFVTE